MHSIEWAAGLFEGEGSFHKDPRSNNRQIRIEMTDKDVLDSFEKVFPGGTWYNRHRYSHCKPTYTYQIGKKNLVIHAVSKMLPHLHSRRAYQALNILDDLELNN